MKLPKLDFKGIATKAGGHALGLALVTQVNRIPAIAKMDTTKAKTKGAIIAALGYVGVPFALSAIGMKGSKKGDFTEHIGDGMGVFGVAMLGNSFAPNIFPKVSGIAGYEENAVLGLGLVTDESVDGYEEPAVLGTNTF